MIFLENRRELEKILYAKLFHKSAPAEAKAILKKLQDENVIKPEEILYITGDSSKFSILNDREIFKIAKAVKDAFPDTIRLRDYFMQRDIDSYSISPDQPDKNPLLFENAFQIAEDQWSCVASIRDLAILDQKGLVKADPNFQRQNKTLVDSNDRIFEMVYVNRRRVEEIKDLIIEDKFFYNTIRLSVINDGLSPSPFFDEDYRTVSVHKKSPIIIIDGNHRFLAASAAYWAAPEQHERFKNTYFNLIISFLTPNETRDCIYQEWNTEPINRRHKAAIKTVDENTVLSIIKASDNADPIYTERIVSSKSERGRLYFNDLAYAIKKCYLPKEKYTRNELISIANWIIEFFNHCVGYMQDSLIKNKPRTHWGCSSAAWIGFIYLSSILKGRDDWKEVTTRLINEINWNSSCPIESRYPIMILKYWEEKWREV